MKRRSGMTASRPKKLLDYGAMSTAFLLPVILAAAYLNMGQTCCGSNCPPPPPPDFRVSVTSDGVAADDQSAEGFVSGQGNDIAFSSHADNLDPGASLLPGPQVFVHNIVTKDTTWVSLGALGEPGAASADAPVVSRYGQSVAFEQQFFGPPVTYSIIFRDLHALPAGFETLISGSSPVSDPTMSAYGRHVAFATEAALLAEDTDALSDVYLKDRQTGALKFLSSQANPGYAASDPQLSGDGLVHAFAVDADTPYAGTIVSDVAGIQFLVYLAGDRPALSDDGSLVAFRRTWPGIDRIYVDGLLTGSTQEVSLDAWDAPTTEDCDDPVLSGNGRFVAFRCVAPMTNHAAWNQVYVRDLVEQTTKLASVNVDGVPANSADSKPVGMPSNGNAVIIESSADNLGDVPGGFPQLFRVPIRYWQE